MNKVILTLLIVLSAKSGYAADYHENGLESILGSQTGEEELSVSCGCAEVLNKSNFSCYNGVSAFTSKIDGKNGVQFSKDNENYFVSFESARNGREKNYFTILGETFRVTNNGKGSFSIARYNGKKKIEDTIKPTPCTFKQGSKYHNGQLVKAIENFSKSGKDVSLFPFRNYRACSKLSKDSKPIQRSLAMIREKSSNKRSEAVEKAYETLRDSSKKKNINSSGNSQ
ncbi:hypothetical protein [Halobacteriovorax sp. CON-3]|uniref:hypothetical protein n=1 Tax=Halobacteriovorax sp. CON-3 TaxID=3157710 RepID=UPI003721F0FB